MDAGPTVKDPKNKFFVESAKEYGLEGVTATHLYAVDFNNDGYSDLVVLSGHYSAPEFFQFDKSEKRFKKLENSPLEAKIRASFLVFADLDRDGILDLLVGTLNQKTELAKHPLRLFKGRIQSGQTIYNEVLGAFTKNQRPTASIGLLDYNLDGNLDLYQGNWFDFKTERPRPIPDKIFRGSGLRFSPVKGILEKEARLNKRIGIFPNARPTFGVSTCDLDQNGYPDVLTAASSGHANKLWMNVLHRETGTRIYRDYGKDSGYAGDADGIFDSLSGGNTFFSTCADYNNDGIMDLAVGELYHSYDNESKDRSSILTGSRPYFPPKFIRTEYDRDYSKESWSQGDRRGVWFDYDNDGYTDLLIDNSGFPPHSRLILFHQVASGEYKNSYENVSTELGLDLLNPSGTIVIDLNQDGRLDFISGQTNTRNANIPRKLYVFENRTPTKTRKALRFYLVGKQSNRKGLGAMVILKSKEYTARRWVEYSGGSLPSQNEEGIHFGFEKKNPVSSVSVRWPFAKKDKAGRSKPPLVKYDLSKQKLGSYTELTLCENGKLVKGRNSNCEI
ncbi:MAG: CRTAC1 family protein [Halobacteriovoraceae bacterium]|nr:CRTAC1 family protein [Halobacteriovoraceae bacterium]MBT5093248.1 CRTAC1 family protein [Halobacteriovoraceae bacterium]